MAYTDANRAFIQAFMAHRVLTFEDAKPILTAILSASSPNSQHRAVTPQTLQTFITAANTALSPYDFQIRSIPSQTGPAPRTTYHILTNTTSDELLQLATTHSAEEIAFFKRLLDAMFETNNTPRMELCAVRSMEAVRLHKPPALRPGDGSTQPTQTSTGLSMKEAESALRAFVEEGWLDSSPEGYYTLSVRALAELSRYLVDTYNADADPDVPDSEPVERIKSCYGCKELLTVGLRCPNMECGVRLHDACAEGLFRSNRAPKCLVCGGEWAGRCYVGERAVKAGRMRAGEQESRTIGRGSAVAGPSLGGQASRRGQGEMEEEEEE
ncbi:Nse1 non-SMC component of SMC5-6 complex-domain-containing protein [Kalaharituber pfeilii]|nr:Nse1 non-SMC component of SMC5-6 complex-domain-containing protein [Kalaharituber pfeilii]